MGGTRTPGVGRLVGLDLFRAVAVFGMLVAHVGPAAVDAGGVHWQWEVFHSRMPAMFAFAAGVSMTLTTGGPRPFARDALVTPRVTAVVRAGALTAIGLVLARLGTPAVVILVYFGAYILLTLPVLGWDARRLAVLAAVLAVVGPGLSFVVRTHLTDPGNAVLRLLVQGDYPAATWLPFVVAGMAAGRLDLGSRRVQARLAVSGAVLSAVAYGGSALAMAAGVEQRLLDGFAGSPAEQHAQLSALLHAETGVTPTTDPAWLLTAAPHSGSWPDVLGCLGVCLLLLGVLLPLGRRLASARSAPRPVSSPLRSTGRTVGVLVGGAAAAVGSMVLSVYVAHIVAMAALRVTVGYDFEPAQPGWVLAAFTVGLAVAAAFWAKWFRRGPVESVLHVVTTRTAGLLTARVAAGSRPGGG